MTKIKNKLYNLLKNTQKYTKTDNVYLFKHGSWLTLAQIISSFSSFLLALVFANLLPKETYGLYQYVLSVASLLAIPTLSGLDIALTQAISRGIEGSFKKGLKTKINWGLFGSLASLILAGYYYFSGNTTLTISFLICAVFLPFMDAFNLFHSVLGGRKRFDLQAQYVTFIKISSVIVIILTIYLTNNLFSVILVYFLSYTLLRLIILVKILKKFPLNKKIDPQTIPYGKHLTLIRVISVAANYIDKILVFHFLGAVELAVYSFAIVPSDQIKAVLKNIESLLLPKYSLRDVKEIKQTIFSKMFKLSALIGLVVLIYIILAPWLYQIFFPQYSESVFLSQIFSISLIATVSSLPYTALQAKMAKKQLYQFNILAPLIRIGLLFILIYFYGLLGIVVARVIGRFTNLAFTSWLIKKS